MQTRQILLYGILLLCGFHVLSTTSNITVQRADAANQPLFINDAANPLAFDLPMTAREIVEKRTEQSVVFDLGMGKRAAVGYGTPLFAKNNQGQWIPIMQDGQREGDSFAFSLLADDVDIRFDLTKPRYELMQGNHGYSVAFQSDAIGIIENSTTVRYHLADGVTLRWTVDGNRVRKEIFINKHNSTLPSFTIVPLHEEQIQLTDNHFSILDADGTERFSTATPFLAEKDGTIIDRPVRIQHISNNAYRYIYDDTELPLPYILDPSEGPNDPGTLEDDDAVGTVTWSNPGNAAANDASYATATDNVSTTNSFYLKATNFGFTIPTGATIDGIVVEIDRKCSDDSSDYCTDNIVRLQKSSFQGDNKAIGSATHWPTSDAYATYGASNDLWGLSFTPSDINASDFGVGISATLNTSGGPP